MESVAIDGVSLVLELVVDERGVQGIVPRSRVSNKPLDLCSPEQAPCLEQLAQVQEDRQTYGRSFEGRLRSRLRELAHSPLIHHLPQPPPPSSPSS